MAGSPPDEYLIPLFVWSIINDLQYCYWRSPNGKLLVVAVDHNMLRTMASDTVDLIDWPLPPFTEQYPLIIKFIL